MKKSNETQHIATSNNGLNKLRAAVLGANDGIVSTAGIILGVAGASANKETILISGAAGVIAGAISMAAGEFVSVSSQRDSEESYLNNIKSSRVSGENSRINELEKIYIDKGFSKETARKAVLDLQANNSLEKELDFENGVNTEDISNPWAAAIASAAAFTAGAVIPLSAVALAPDSWRISITVAAVIIALALAGIFSAQAGQSHKARAALRIVVWGISAMAITFAIGSIFGSVAN